MDRLALVALLGLGLSCKEEEEELDVGVVAVATIGDYPHAPFPGPAPELDVEAPAEVDVAPRALDEDAVAKTVASGRGGHLRSRVEIERGRWVVEREGVSRVTDRPESLFEAMPAERFGGSGGGRR